MSLAQDLRFAIRGLKEATIFTAVAMISIAFGIGANTAIFSPAAGKNPERTSRGFFAACPPVWRPG